MLVMLVVGEVQVYYVKSIQVYYVQNDCYGNIYVFDVD